MELLGTYGEVIFWPPNRDLSKDMVWVEIPVITDNLGNDCVLKKTILRKGQRLGFYSKMHPVIWEITTL